jgi:hypothetical protein
VANGGEDEIRTHDTCYSIAAFQATAFNRSATSPQVFVERQQSATLAAEHKNRKLQRTKLSIRLKYLCTNSIAIDI